MHQLVVKNCWSLSCLSLEIGLAGLLLEITLQPVACCCSDGAVAACPDQHNVYHLPTHSTLSLVSLQGQVKQQIMAMTKKSSKSVEGSGDRA